jgi:hypothetical protein
MKDGIIVRNIPVEPFSIPMRSMILISALQDPNKSRIMKIHAYVQASYVLDEYLVVLVGA